MGLTHNRFPQIRMAARAKAAQAVRKAADDVARQAQDLAPVDTGELRGSIAAESTGALSAEVSVGAFHGHFLEYGTSKMAPHAFLGPAADRVEPDFQRDMRRIAE